MKEYFFQLACAVCIGIILDCLLGDPRNFPHSVNLIGNSIRKAEKLIRRHMPVTPKAERLGGLMLAAAICLISAFIPLIILAACYLIDPLLSIVDQGLMIWQIIAAKSLMRESKKVYDALKQGDLPAARYALSMIVGRDTKELTEEGVIKAAVETVAENTSDGVTAPMMYIFIGGAPLGYLYKAINTMDSILGYKNERYLNFGRYPAKLDDIANFIPSRLTALLMIAASFLLGFDGRNAIRIFRRDRAKHASPNSAQTESVCAGALGVRLAGDIRYFGKVHKKDYIGDPIREIEAEDIIRSHRLMYGTAALTALIFFVAYGLLYFNL